MDDFDEKVAGAGLDLQEKLREYDKQEAGLRLEIQKLTTLRRLTEAMLVMARAEAVEKMPLTRREVDILLSLTPSWSYGHRPDNHELHRLHVRQLIDLEKSWTNGGTYGARLTKAGICEQEALKNTLAKAKGKP